MGGATSILSSLLRVLILPTREWVCTDTRSLCHPLSHVFLLSLGYLASSLLLHENHELNMLLVNSIQRVSEWVGSMGVLGVVTPSEWSCAAVSH